MEPLFAKIIRNDKDNKIVEFFSTLFTNIHYEDGFVTRVVNDIYTFQSLYSGQELELGKAFLRQPVSFYNDPAGGSVRNGFIDIDENHTKPNAQLYGLDGEKRNYVGKLILGWVING